MKFLPSLLVGLPVVYLAVAVIADGFANALMIMTLSIICTAGIALVLWIPLFIATGWLILQLTKWVVRLVSQSTPVGDVETTAPVLQPAAIFQRVKHQVDQNQQGILVYYIQRAVSLGHDYSKILTTLQQHGWSEQEIRQTYDNVVNPSL